MTPSRVVILQRQEDIDVFFCGKILAEGRNVIECAACLSRTDLALVYVEFDGRPYLTMHTYACLGEHANAIAAAAMCLEFHH